MSSCVRYFTRLLMSRCFSVLHSYFGTSRWFSLFLYTPYFKHKSNEILILWTDINLYLISHRQSMWKWTLTEFTFFRFCVGHFVSFLRRPTFHGNNFLFWKERGHERHSILAILVQQKGEGRRFFTIYTSKQMDEREGNNVRNRSNEVSRLWEFVRGFAVLDNKAKRGWLYPH